MFLLDTYAVIAALRGNAALLARIHERRPPEVAISSIVAHELYYGAFKGKRIEENLATVDALQFEMLDFDREDARCAGEIRAALSEKGETIGPYDVLIAGQALSRGLILVTRNTREFSRVTDLRLEDWESP
jgi:tRNA(fMet)-specific endonuclease VapC